MLSSFIAALNDKDLRGRLGFILLGFAIFVLAVHIPVPGVNKHVWNRLLSQGELFSFLGMFTGGALNRFSIAAMGITPYINASIIMQLLTVVVPKLHEYQKEGGELGRRKINRYVRFLTVGLALLQSLVMVISLSKWRGEGGESIFFYGDNFFYLIMISLAITAGTCFLIFLGEKISEKGIGNGVSMIIFAGIVVRYPQYLHQTIQTAAHVTNPMEYYIRLVLFAIIALALIVAIIMLTQGIRKVPVQYAKRVVGRRVMGGQSSYIPIKVNNAGVISIIFAISILYLPTTFTGFLKTASLSGFAATLVNTVNTWFDPRSFFYNLCYVLLVIFFTYFYSAITFNIKDVADNMKKNGGFIPGIRPGQATVDYLEKIMSRITFISAIALAVIAVAPNFVMMMTGVNSFYLGSTSMLIIVGVALDTMHQIEARLVMKNYQGFMK